MISALVAIVALSALLAYREWLHAQERKHATEERATLLNRIQAPEIAVAEAIDQPYEGLGYVPIDDDKQFQAEMERLSE